MMSAREIDWLKRLLENKKLPDMLERAGSLTVVPMDPDLNGATMGQAWLILKGVPELAPSMTDAVSFRANCVGMKLNALRYHRKRYEEIQARRVSEFSSNTDLKDSIQLGVKIAEVEMLYEVEAFFSQYKSCLDMLVKVLCPITGLQPGTLSSYGDFGNRIITRLNNLKKTNHKLTIGRIDWLIEEIEKTKPWLESVIRIRDTYTHYRSEIHFGFEWDKAVGRIRVPHSDLDGKSSPLNLSRAIWKIGSNVIRSYTAEDIANAKKAAAG